MLTRKWRDLTGPIRTTLLSALCAFTTNAFSQQPKQDAASREQLIWSIAGRRFAIVLRSGGGRYTEFNPAAFDKRKRMHHAQWVAQLFS